MLFGFNRTKSFDLNSLCDKSGLVFMREESCSRGCGFNSWHRILDVHLSQIICNNWIVWSITTKINKNRPRMTNLYKNRLSTGCCTVGIAVASDNRVPQFKSSHWKFLFTLSCIDWKGKNLNNEPGNGPKWDIIRKIWPNFCETI